MKLKCQANFLENGSPRIRKTYSEVLICQIENPACYKESYTDVVQQQQQLEVYQPNSRIYFMTHQLNLKGCILQFRAISCVKYKVLIQTKSRLETNSIASNHFKSRFETVYPEISTHSFVAKKL